jgi:antitoxin HicB
MRYGASVSKLSHAVLIEPLSLEEGGGFVAVAPDLPGCMGDGETPEEALRNIQDAIAEWIDEAQALSRPVPPPSRRFAAAE